MFRNEIINVRQKSAWQVYGKARKHIERSEDTVLKDSLLKLEDLHSKVQMCHRKETQ
jgi:hypothetical protein